MAVGGVPTGVNLAENCNNDTVLPEPPSDSVSSLAFSPVDQILAAGSWNNEVHCWNVGKASSDESNAKISTMRHQAPVLTTCFGSDASTLFSGSCDHLVKMWDLESFSQNRFVNVAAHDAPVQKIKWVQESRALLSASWDRTLKYWDTRSNTAVQTVNLAERAYAMDVRYPIIVIACADRHIIMLDARTPEKPLRSCTSPLKFQSRSLACFPDGEGFALGSIEGRVAIHHVAVEKDSHNFAFKCHRKEKNIYAINAIAFHEQHKTFATGGSDGIFNFWDKDARQRLKGFNPMKAPITDCVFDSSGELFAYSVSYDWSKGHKYKEQMPGSAVFVHKLRTPEISPRRRI